MCGSADTDISCILEKKAQQLLVVPPQPTVRGVNGKPGKRLFFFLFLSNLHIRRWGSANVQLFGCVLHNQIMVFTQYFLSS